VSSSMKRERERERERKRERETERETYIIFSGLVEEILNTRSN